MLKRCPCRRGGDFIRLLGGLQAAGSPAQPPAGCPGRPARCTGSSGRPTAPATPATSPPGAALATTCPPDLSLGWPPAQGHQHTPATPRQALLCRHVPTHVQPPAMHCTLTYVCTPPYVQPPICTHIPHCMLRHTPPHTHTHIYMAVSPSTAHIPHGHPGSPALTPRYNRTHGYTRLAQTHAGWG